MKKTTTVDFSEIFWYAEEEFKISWNDANDIFFREEVLTYKGYDELDPDYLSEHFYDLSDKEIAALSIADCTSKTSKGKLILIRFMEKHNLKEMTLLNG